MPEFWSKLFDTADFPARWQCGNWSAGLGWLHIVSDLAVFGAYVTIPAVLIFFMRKRGDLPFSGIFWLFGAFIFACGTTHLIEASIFWEPWYRFSGLAKLVTAIVSWLTVIALIPTIPKALALPALVTTNERLEYEVAEQRGEAERLQRTADELKLVADVVVDREERVIELKSDINALLDELGQPHRYELSTH